MTLGEIISAHLLEQKMSQRQFAKLCGLSNGYISMLIKNASPHANKPIVPSLTTLWGISKGLGITFDQLLERADDIGTNISAGKNLHNLISSSAVFVPKMKKVPILGKTACGEPIYSPNFDDGYALIGEDFQVDFALECDGDSMKDAGINNGDVVYFKDQDAVDNGQIAAVFVDNEVTLKKVYYYREKNRLVLQPANPAYEPLIYEGAELNSIRILGLAVAHLRRI